MARPPKTTTAPTGQIPPFGLRMLPELKEKIEACARANGRSMNAEIVARLEQTFGPITVTANQLAEPASQVATARVVPNDELTAAVAGAVEPAMDRMERRYLRMHMRSLQDQKRVIEDSLKFLHNPLAIALEELENATAVGDPAQLQVRRAEVATIRKRMEALDEQIAQVEREIGAVRRELGDVGAEGDTPAQRAEALRRLSEVHRSS